MALALLVVFAVEGGEGKASEAFSEVGVKVDTAGMGLGTFSRAHVAHDEGADEVFVAKFNEVTWAVAEEFESCPE